MVLVPFCTTWYLQKRLFWTQRTTWWNRSEKENETEFSSVFQQDKTRHSKHGKHSKRGKHLLAMPWESHVEIQTKIQFFFPIYFYFIMLYVEFKIIKMPQFNLHKHSINYKSEPKYLQWFVDVFFTFLYQTKQIYIIRKFNYVFGVPRKYFFVW